MADDKTNPVHDLVRAAEARALAERGLHEQAIGHTEQADDLLTHAAAIDPEAVDEVLREHDAARAPDARFQTTADQDVEHLPPGIVPRP